MVLAALGLAAWRFHLTGYLPQPFHYDSSASLMDLYTSAYWANRPGAYEVWRAIYPPLSFVALRLSTLHSCYGVSDLLGRRCDWLVRLALLGFFVINFALVYLAFARKQLRAALPRTAALCLGLPMLYGLERGNLVIPCFTFLVLARGELLRSRIARWLAMAISLNLKPYLLVVILPYVAQRRWRWLIGCGAAGFVVYLISFVLEGSGTPWQLFDNLVLYAHSRPGDSWSALYYATSYWPLARLMPSMGPLTHLLPAGDVTAIRITVEVLIRGAQVGAVACFVAACRRPGGINPNRFLAMALAAALTTIATGSSGYAQIFLLLFVFLEEWSGATRIAMLVSAYLLCVPFDYVLWPVAMPAMHSFLGEREVLPQFGVSVGHLVRPGLLLVIQYGLIIINFRDVLRSPAPSRRGLGREEPADARAMNRGAEGVARAVPASGPSRPSR
ncbi:MAG: hypothetical protein ACRED8_03825 [Caulobacteraceae bacterium]